MRNSKILAFFIVFFSLGLSAFFANAEAMQLASTAFENGATIPVQYTCDGQNIHPPVSFVDIPKNTRSLVLIVHDPDAPAGDWTHWTLWDIPATMQQIAENEMPKGAVTGMNSFAQTGYGGPCPPSGQRHHYAFDAYALDTSLILSNQNTRQELLHEMKPHILAQAELVGLYGR